MCGGIGSRFWPYSRAAKPKQFIDFLGTGRSLLQMTFDRVARLVPPQNVVVVTNQAYEGLIREQLPMLRPENVLLEPARRNTAPCIAWAASHINAICPGASMIVTPADHVVVDTAAFESKVRAGFEFVEGRDALLTLGIEPNRPETGYGYIRLGERVEGDIYKVRQFMEKPDLATAKRFLEEGDYMWNAGIFLWSVKSILRAFELYMPKDAGLFREAFAGGFSRERLERAFGECTATSIDYGIMEKAGNVFVEKADMGWSDLGTWSSLHELSPRDADENFAASGTLLAADSRDNVVMAPEGKLVVLKNLNGYIVADNGEALLICPKASEQEIKSLLSDIDARYL